MIQYTSDRGRHSWCSPKRTEPEQVEAERVETERVEAQRTGIKRTGIERIVETTDATGPLAAAPHRSRDRLVVAIGALGALAVLLAHRSSPFTAVWLAVVVAVSAWLSVIDFREHRLPNRIVGPLAAFVCCAVVVTAAIEADLGRGARAFGFGVAVTAVLLLANIAGGLGMGDVKYGFPWAITIGWFGWPPLSLAIVVTTVAGAIVAVAVLVSGRGRGRRLSYGPYMALGLIAGLLAAA